MKMMSRSLVLAAGVLALGLGLATAGGAAASEKDAMQRAACAVQPAPDGSKPAHLSDAELRSKLETAGYTKVRSLGREEGCVEAKGIDKDGKRFEVYLHPATGEIVSRQ